MPQYIALRKTPFTPEQDETLASTIRSGGYEPIFMTGDETPDGFPWDECVALMGAFSKDCISMMPNLRWVQTAWAGVDSLRGAAYPSPDTVLCNGSGGYGPIIAEYLLGAALMLLHRIDMYIRAQGRREWNWLGAARSLRGGTVMVIGLGDIGGQFARYAKALGATVLGVRRTQSAPPEGVDELIPYERLIDVLPRADVVAMTLPATDETAGLFSARHVAAMKPDAVFLNIGRGVTVDEDALIRALSSRSIAGAVLDVVRTEPLPRDNPLWTLDNVVITPHVSGRMDDPANAALIYQIFEDNLQRFLDGRPLRNVVDRVRGY
ncbi:MAG: D-2-hydroxyacid dehydrogenase [Oscillospiraceae bacterium]|nr:D-2-hydroxyacid dehydrogenase [Oscillospiraceae bacterium]